MDTLQILTLALVQGFTEFLPISSSAHLILVPVVTGWPDQGLAFDVAVHAGTLLAVVIYFRQELITMLQSSWQWLQGGPLTAEVRLALAVVVGTIPVGLVGLLAKDFIEIALRGPLVIAVTTLVFGILLGVVDRWTGQQRSELQLRWQDVVVVGIAQAIALIPGTSRSGITLAAGMAMGLTRAAAARFSFLLSIPVIILAGLLQTVDLLTHPVPGQGQVLLLGATMAAVSAYLCIHVFLTLIEQVGLLPFVIYRLLLGTVLLAIFW